MLGTSQLTHLVDHSDFYSSWFETDGPMDFTIYITISQHVCDICASPLSKEKECTVQFFLLHHQPFCHRSCWFCDDHLLSLHTTACLESSERLQCLRSSNICKEVEARMSVDPRTFNIFISQYCACHCVPHFGQEHLHIQAPQVQRVRYKEENQHYDYAVIDFSNNKRLLGILHH